MAHQIIIEAQDFDGTLFSVSSGSSVPAGIKLRFIATGLIPYDFNTAEFVVQDSDGFDVLDVFESSNLDGVASTDLRTFVVPGEYTVAVFARDLANQESRHARGQATFTISGVENEQLRSNNGLPKVLASLAVVGAAIGLAVVVSRNR